jgi:hypothetical protein
MPARIDSAGVWEAKRLKPAPLGKVAKSALGVALTEAKLGREIMRQSGLARMLIVPLERP